MFDQATYDKLLKEVPGYKLISTSVLSDRMKLNGSLARRAINILAEKKLIVRVGGQGQQKIYTKAVSSGAADE